MEKPWPTDSGTACGYLMMDFKVKEGCVPDLELIVDKFDLVKNGVVNY